MTPKTFASLAAAAALSLVVAIAVHAARQPWAPSASGTTKLFPGLAADAGKVARVTLTQGGDTLTLEKSGDAWLMKSQDGYPASTDKVRALIAALADARLLEPKTSLAARHAALEVDDPAVKLTRARLVRLEDQSGAVLAEVIAGKSKAAGHTAGASATAETYVRRPGDDQSWLASTDIAGDAKLKSWAEARVFETPGDSVTSLTVELPGQPAYVIRRGEDGAHTLADIPAGKRVKYVNMIDNIVEAATFLDLDKVRKATSTPGGDISTVSFETATGLKISLKIRRDKDDTWVSVDAKGEGEAQKTAADINARAAGWEFVIVPSKVDTMLKKQEDLLEDAAS
jgi:hypothetical protein